MNGRPSGKTLAVLAATLFVGAAGCLRHDPRNDPLGQTAGAAWHFTNALVDTGADTEVSTVVGPDGLVLICSHGGFDQPSPSWVSQDAGLTFRRLDPQPNPAVSGDCDWAILDDGSWALAYDTLASSTVAVTSDQGATWSFDYAAATPYGGVDRPWLASEGSALYLAYANVMAEEPAIDTLAVSTDHGRNWDRHIAHTTTLEGAGRPNNIIGHPLVQGSTIRIPITSNNMYTTAVAGSGQVILSILTSRDGGTTWTDLPVAGPHANYLELPSLDRAADGTLFLTKSAGPVGDMAIDVLVSRDDGATWSTVHIADHVAMPNVSGPWVDARPDGSATVVWMHQDANGRAVWGARIDADGVRIPAGPLMDPVQDTSSYEFVMVDHDAEGRAFIGYPMDTGDCTHAPAPAAGRSVQCLWLLSEDVRQGA